MKEEVIVYISATSVCIIVALIFLIVHLLIKRNKFNRFTVNRKLNIWEFTKKHICMFVFWCFLILTAFFIVMLIPLIK